MKNAGSYKITRQGQITIPAEARKELNLGEGDTVDMYFTADLLILKKRKEPQRIFEDLAINTSKRFKKQKITPDIVTEEISAERMGE